MFHLVDNFQDKSGNALAGYYVKLKVPGGAYATLYADTSSTPIISVSGFADTAVTDANGRYDLYVNDGSYDIEFFDRNDINQRILTISAVPMFAYADGIPVTPLQYGAAGNGTTDDTDAIDAALATGRTVVLPEGYTFLTSGLHQVTTNNQRIVIDGTLKYDGERRFIATGVYGFQGLFQVQDQVEGVVFEGSGVMDGNWRRAGATVGQPLEFRDAGAGIYAYRAIGMRVRGITFQHFSEDGVKAFNCPNLVIEPTCTFYDICNVGVELHSYLNDPRTAVPWVGAVQPPSGSIDGFYDWIDDGEKFLNFGNGVGVAFNASSGALPVQNLTIGGNFRDCLAAIWSENNYAGSEAQNITIVGVTITGNYRGAGTAETLQGIGLIGVQNSTVVAPVIRNVGNVAPAPGSNSAGMHIVQCEGVTVIAPRIIDDTGAVDRTQYGIRINAGSDITILHYDISGMATSDILEVSAPTNVKKIKLAAAQAAITAPTGGATVDAEARTAINTIRTVLTAHGLTL